MAQGNVEQKTTVAQVREQNDNPENTKENLAKLKAKLEENEIRNELAFDAAESLAKDRAKLPKIDWKSLRDKVKAGDVIWVRDGAEVVIAKENPKSPGLFSVPAHTRFNVTGEKMIVGEMAASQMATVARLGIDSGYRPVLVTPQDVMRGNDK